MPKEYSVGEARREILSLANKIRLTNETSSKPFTMKHLQQAVFVVRQADMAPAGLMEAAGFRAVK